MVVLEVPGHPRHREALVKTAVRRHPPQGREGLAVAPRDEDLEGAAVGQQAAHRLQRAPALVGRPAGQEREKPGDVGAPGVLLQALGHRRDEPGARGQPRADEGPDRVQGPAAAGLGPSRLLQGGGAHESLQDPRPAGVLTRGQDPRGTQAVVGPRPPPGPGGAGRAVGQDGGDIADLGRAGRLLQHGDQRLRVGAGVGRERGDVLDDPGRRPAGGAHEVDEHLVVAIAEGWRRAQDGGGRLDIDVDQPVGGFLAHDELLNELLDELAGLRPVLGEQGEVLPVAGAGAHTGQGGRQPGREPRGARVRPERGQAPGAGRFQSRERPRVSGRP